MGLLRQSRFISGGAMGTKEKGNRCEDIVADFLVGKGHEIIARNYRCRYGEIDILSLCQGVLCVVEVKSLTRRWDASDVQYMVDPAKRMRLRRTLSIFLSELEGRRLEFNSIRFDVATVTDGSVSYYIGEY